VTFLVGRIWILGRYIGKVPKEGTFRFSYPLFYSMDCDGLLLFLFWIWISSH